MISTGFVCFPIPALNDFTYITYQSVLESTDLWPLYWLMQNGRKLYHFSVRKEWYSKTTLIYLSIDIWYTFVAVYPLGPLKSVHSTIIASVIKTGNKGKPPVHFVWHARIQYTRQWVLILPKFVYNLDTHSDKMAPTCCLLLFLIQGVIGEYVSTILSDYFFRKIFWNVMLAFFNFVCKLYYTVLRFLVRDRSSDVILAAFYNLCYPFNRRNHELQEMNMICRTTKGSQNRLIRFPL